MGKKADKKDEKKAEKKAEKKLAKLAAMPTIDQQYLLTTKQMAEFVARGFLRFDELVPDAINQDAMAEFDAGTTKSAPAGTPLSQCYPPESAVGRLLALPQIQGIIYSLVGPEPAFDHQAIHVRQPNEGKAQGMHGDSIIDTRLHFDIQLMYFPTMCRWRWGGRWLSLAANIAASTRWTLPAIRTSRGRFRWSARRGRSWSCIMASGIVAARTRRIRSVICSRCG